MGTDRPTNVLEVKRDGGLYMMCRMFGEKVPFLIDSGASCSLIDVSIFLALSSERHIPLSKIHETFAVANGGELLVHGEIVVNLQVGRRSYPQALVVADLGSRSAILGLDFMRRHRAVLRAASGTLNPGRTTVLLHREKGRQRCNRVSLTETLTIPPRSMKVVEVEVGREVLASHDEVPDVGVVEGLASLVELTGLMAVGGVVSVKEGKVPVNLLNVHDDAIDLKEGVTVGRLVAITTVTRSVSKVSLSDSAGVNGRLLTDESIPEHIRCVLGEESVLTAEQKSAVFELVNDFPEGFLEPKGKTGRDLRRRETAIWQEREQVLVDPTFKSGSFGIVRYFEPITSISVLSSFSFSIFATYHARISSMAICMLDTASFVDMLNEVYN